ncbi:MAG: decarboxylase [Beggiatoa sp. IS2]|nr:MAG: decarboxylase [Beggiatoa sp. IS2]
MVNCVNELLLQITRDFGTPCFVYFFDKVVERVGYLRQSFDQHFYISYAVKSNPNPEILRGLQGQVNLLDVSSGGELLRAIKQGWAPELLSFTGPGKRDSELRMAVSQKIGEVIVESVNEAERLNAIAAQAGVTQGILVRIAPKKLPRGFGVNMSGKPTQFGIDEEEINQAVTLIKQLPHLDLQGFHIYSGTQCLRPESIVENYQIFIDIFRYVCETHNVNPKKLIFGSGLGIPYHEGDQPLDLTAVATRINPVLEAFQQESRFSQTQFILELGRYLIGEAGFYLTRVINKKLSRGTEICVCDGGMNHHLGACGHLGSVIHRNYQMFKVTQEEEAVTQTYNLVGPLCTSIDTLGHNVKLPALDVGDVIAIRCSGAYGLTASPVYFISHEPPKEILVKTVKEVLSIQDISQLSVRSLY